MVSIQQQSALRHISEDAKLRPFLSPLFDSQTYIKTIIKEGKSEECFNNIVKCVDDINEEIKSYISEHKDELMSGMQDVTALADRYVNLSAKSHKLHRNIQRLRNEATESHELVASRTSELERIHTTSITLHQLKAFVHAKSELDAYIKSPDDKDTRNLSSAAKTVSELEKLLLNPSLVEVKLVGACAEEIKAFGQGVRLKAQEKLLGAIAEKNQAAIANSLQVFYNLDSLAEILLLVIDVTMKSTVERSRTALDVESVQSLLQPDGHHGSSAAPGAGATSSLAALAPMSASKKPAASSSAASAGAGGAAQVRTALREVAHVWSSIIHEMALQVHALQRVVAKKEDPTTHEKFLSVLQRLRVSQSHNHGSTAATTALLLSRGQLLDLFWHRLCEALQDVANEKVKHHAQASTRAYPFIRRAALDVLANLRNWTEQSGSLSQGVLTLSSTAWGDTDDDCADGAGQQCAAAGGMFGSLLWSQDDLLNSSGRYSIARTASLARGRTKTAGKSAAQGDIAAGPAGVEDTESEAKEHSLVHGLRPMRDKYLLVALHHMSAPIAQMFPELDGYTAAVPSKRDLLALTKAILAEFVAAMTEGDPSLVQLLCKEFLKTVKLMLTKIEGMVLNSADTRTISSAASNFARTQAQAHNANLLVLLVQFKEALLKLPGQVLASSTADASSSSLLSTSTSAGSSNGQNSESSLNSSAAVRSIENAVQTTAQLIEDLASKQILDPVVGLLSSYVTSIVVAMQKEGVVAPSTPGAAPAVSAGTPAQYTGRAPSAAAGQEAWSDCSAAVQTLLRNLPVLLKAHLLSLPKCDAVVAATEEIYVRVLHSYITVAALQRPVTESSRLRTTKDMAALEQLLSSLYMLPNPNACPVLREYRAFRRLLFEQYSADDSTVTATKAPPATPSNAKTSSANANPAPDARELLRLPYVAHLRPSTLLGYLLSCGPAQLPAPFEATQSGAGSDSLSVYVDMLTDVFRTQRLGAMKQKSSRDLQQGGEATVRALYSDSVEGWRDIANETQSWEMVQQALDTFFQRIAVAETSQRQIMRKWYEAIMDVGSKII